VARRARLVLSVVVSGLEAIRPWFTKYAVDVNIAERTRRPAPHLGAIFRGADRARAGAVRQRLPHAVDRQKTILDLRMQVFTHLQKLGSGFSTAIPSAG